MVEPVRMNRWSRVIHFWLYLDAILNASYAQTFINSCPTLVNSTLPSATGCWFSSIFNERYTRYTTLVVDPDAWSVIKQFVRIRWWYRETDVSTGNSVLGWLWWMMGIPGSGSLIILVWFFLSACLISCFSSCSSSWKIVVEFHLFFFFITGTLFHARAFLFFYQITLFLDEIIFSTNFLSS